MISAIARDNRPGARLVQWSSQVLNWVIRP